MLICSDRFDGLIGVDAGDGSNDDSFKAVMCQQVFIRIVQSHTEGFQVLLRPFNLNIIWRADRNELGSRRAVEKVQCMSFSHTTQA